MSEHRPAEFVPDADSGRQPRRNRRPVIDPAGVLHPSIQAAANAHGLWPAGVFTRCCKRHAGWRFAEPAVATPGGEG